MSELNRIVKIKNSLVTKEVKEIDVCELYSSYNVSTVFEVIKQTLVKPYFDYDEYVSDNDYIKTHRVKLIRKLYNLMKWYFNEEDVDIFMFDASGYNPIKDKWKFSFRIIIDGWGGVQPLEIVERILPSLQTVIEKKKWNIKFDESVYKSIDKMQLMLMPYRCKEGNPNRVFKKIDLNDKFYNLIEVKDILEEEYIRYAITYLGGMSQVEWNDDDTSDSDDDAVSSTCKESSIECEAVEAMSRSYEVQREDISELLECLQWKEQNWEWDKWIKVVWCISNIAKENNIDLMPLVHTISRESPKYDAAYTDQVYNDNQARQGKATIGIGTLIRMCKEVNPQKTDAWIMKQKSDCILNSGFTDADFIDYFLEIWPNKFVKCCGRELYVYGEDGNYWSEMKTDSILFTYLDKLYHILLGQFRKVEKSFESKRAIKIYTDMQKLRNYKPQSNIVNKLLKKIETDRIIFDENPHLLGFRNGVYELRTDVFREGKYDDYISRVIPYDWRESTQEDTDLIEKHFSKIFPIEAERALFWRIMASAIHGSILERFIIFTGRGANSKDAVMTYLMPAVFGEHYYRANNTVLTNQIKGDMCASVSCMSKKRLIVYSEPNYQQTLKTAMIKEMTGSRMLNIRGLYEKDGSKTMMCGTHIMLCNEKPLLDVVDDAIQRRLIILPFRATFKNKEEIKNYEDMEYIFEGDNVVKADEFVAKMRLPIMNEILKAYKIFRKDGYDILNITDDIREEAKAYINDSCEFATWFLNKYEFTEDRMEIVKADDVYRAYRMSDLYMNLSKKDKRRITKKNIIKKIEEHPTLKLHYRRRVRFAKLDVESVFIKCKEREVNLDEE